MSIDFTAIDFETANGFRGSACSVGLVKVRDGHIVDEDYWLIKPPPGFDSFEDINISIHGIKPEQVANEATFDEIFPEVGGFIGDDVIVAHNAAFDMGVLKSALQALGAYGPAFDSLCTVRLSRKVYRLPSYSLPFVAKEAGYNLENHHDALEDARACAAIAIDIAHRTGAQDLNELVDILNMRFTRTQPIIPGTFEKPMPKPFRRSWPVEGMNPEPKQDADPSNPLYGKQLVFTGELAISRQEAKNLAAAKGASTSNLVTQNTSILVVGAGFSVQDLQQGRLTAKARTVMKLQKQGKRINVISEDQFMSLVR
ncbi:MAG: exonuclease domain-containing protein [Micrococcaceae bacterium]